MFNEKMPARILAQCLVCSEHLVNVIYEDYGLLVTFIHCGMQKVAVDSEMKISWFSFCMSTCCDKYKRNSPCIHSFVHPSFPSASSLSPSPPDHRSTIHSSIYPQPFILSSDTHSMPIVCQTLSWTLVDTRWIK